MYLDCSCLPLNLIIASHPLKTQHIHASIHASLQLQANGAEEDDDQEEEDEAVSYHTRAYSAPLTLEFYSNVWFTLLWAGEKGRHRLAKVGTTDRQGKFLQMLMLEIHPKINKNYLNYYLHCFSVSRVVKRERKMTLMKTRQICFQYGR